MLARQTILKRVMIVVTAVLSIVAQADAAVYTWKDKNGTTHFTDDRAKVPQAYHNKPLIKDRRPPAESLSSKKKDESKAESKSLPKKNKAKESAEIEKKPDEESLTAAQRSAIQATTNFLKEDILRYEKYYDWPPSRSKYRLLKEAVANATSAKQALLQTISLHDLPLFKDVTEFLQASIAEDEKAQKIRPTTITSTRQTQALINRLKRETGQENQLRKNLVEALNVSE